MKNTKDAGLEVWTDEDNQLVHIVLVDRGTPENRLCGTVTVNFLEELLASIR